jgi:signal transduction histidine kinase/ligand-binding sensor domain-containing protein/DNA-binding response OmpR family regulator
MSSIVPEIVATGKKFAPLLWVLVLVSPSVYSQQSDLAFETFSIDQGMPTNVRCIIQDKIGYLWFGTYNGLYKYDGYSLLSYRYDIDDTSSIGENLVFSLYEDKAGVLWAGTGVGLERFNRATSTFLHYVPNPSIAGEDLSNTVTAICEDKYGVLWVGTSWGLFQFDRMTGKFTALRYDTTDPGSIFHNTVNAIYEDKGGLLWFATAGGLDRYDFETGKFTHYWNDPVNRYERGENRSKCWVNALCEDEAGILWLATNGGLVEFNPKKRTFSTYRFGPNTGQISIPSICQDAMSGFLWLPTWNGLYAFDRRSKTFTRYALKADQVFCERSGTLWFGTPTDVKKLNRTKQPFKRYAYEETICTVAKGAAGTLWMFTFSGWLKFDIRKEQFVPYSFGGGNVLEFVYPGAELAILTEKGGRYGLDSLGNITYLLDATLNQYPNTPSWGCKTAQGYWVGTHTGGFYFFDRQTHHVRLIRDLKLDINNIYEDSFGLLWISTLMGKVYCYHPEKDSIAEFVSDPKNPSSISGKLITQIYEDKKGRLWFATNSGLNRLERSTNSFVHFSERHGLPTNNIRGILEDDHGFLWLNTTKGISKFDPEAIRFRNYDASYGLEPAADLFYGSGYRTRNGEMYFGGARGFTRFHPDSIEDNPFIPPVVITSFKKFDKAHPFSSEIRLPHDENFISFEFAALSLRSPERNQYAYMLEGLDKDWVYSGTRRYASYPGLEPGEYVFRVKASNNDGVWNETGTSMAIVIAPPWWKTSWAYILYAIMLLSVVYLTWQMQVKRMRMAHEYAMSRFEAQKLHEVDQLKSRFFANISHEFRTPLTLILGPVKQMIERTREEDTRNDLRVVHRNANRLLGLVSQLLDLSSLESGNMKLETVPQNVVVLLKTLTLPFTLYAERKRITLTFTSTENEIPAYVDQDKLDKIVTNILSNAFKFTPEGGRIEVEVRRVAGNVTISISDTGIGIPADKLSRIFDRFYQVDGSHIREHEGTGIGLSLTKELVDLHKGVIEAESTEGKGTTFVIRIPLGKEHLKPEEICAPENDGKGVCGAGSPDVVRASGTAAVRQGSFVTEEMLDTEATQTEKPAIGVITETKKPLLLIAEDNADVRYYIGSTVRWDYGILEAIDGEDGWNKAVELMPDVIISDVMMPKLDGFALCDRLKKDERTSHIPVILLTAKALTQDKIEGLAAGADDYIMKPFEPEEVKARIRNLIEQRKRIHEHFRRHGLFEIDEEKVTPADQKFLNKTLESITKHMSDTAFGVEALATEMAVSRSLLLKKLEALVGEPPQELIRRTRLNKAAQLIEGRSGNIAEIALEVGFANPSYFAECFKKQFGVSPSHYQRGPSQ